MRCSLRNIIAFPLGHKTMKIKQDFRHVPSGKPSSSAGYSAAEFLVSTQHWRSRDCRTSQSRCLYTVSHSQTAFPLPEVLISEELDRASCGACMQYAKCWACKQHCDLQLKESKNKDCQLGRKPNCSFSNFFYLYQTQSSYSSEEFLRCSSEVLQQLTKETDFFLMEEFFFKQFSYIGFFSSKIVFIYNNYTSSSLFLFQKDYGSRVRIRQFCFQLQNKQNIILVQRILTFTIAHIILRVTIPEAL